MKKPKKRNAKGAAIDAEVVESNTLTVQPRAITPMVLIQQGLASNASIEQMQQFFDLQLRWEENEAKKAFNAAVAGFKEESVRIFKTKEVGFTNKDGTFTGYKHASLGNIVKIITPVLSRHGLSHRWDVVQDGASITVTCTLTHSMGHSVSVSMIAGKDDSGKKNAIQQIASAVTYLQRYTVLAVTGLAVEDQDDDGKAAEEPVVELITENQGMDLESLMAEVGVAEKPFCTYYKIGNVYQLPASKYAAAIEKLESKRKDGE